MGQQVSDTYKTQVTKDILARLALVGGKNNGVIDVDPEKGTYFANESAKRLLGLAKSRGRTTQLMQKIKLDDLSAASSTKGVVVFFNDKKTPVRVRHLPTPGYHHLFFIEDVSVPLQREYDQIKSGGDIHDLFENAPYGIYRSTFDGTPLRANPTMVAMNGFGSEAELFAHLADTVQWYVEPNRREQFLEELQCKGRVVDFVSEMNVGLTGKRLWISETAWIIYDEHGKPAFIEGTAIEATGRVQQERAMRLAAQTDHLTGLANRSAFNAHLSELIAACGTNKEFAVFLIDIDRFKDVNDIFGHERGDRLLLQLTDRLKQIAPESSFLARLGGDEFAMTLPVAHNIEETASVASILIAEVERAFMIEDTNHSVGASIGIAAYPKHATTGSELLRAADIALYHAKNSGRGRAEFFDVELATEKRKRLKLATELRHADRRGELELYYQSIVDAETGQVAGHEALMRWRHPERGLVSPVEFVPVAEESGYMAAFGAWAIHEACRHAKVLPEHMHIAVNVSASQFYSADLVKVVAEALQIHGVAPHRIELEVTESVVLRNELSTLKMLEELKALGVRIALDDFGTGHSSLSYLQRFAFDKVKIDRSFVRSIISSPVNAAIVRAVLSIGRDLGLDVVAEGVETESERNALREEGCPYFQGFLYSKPRPFDSLVADLNTNLLRGVLAPESDAVEVRAALA